MTTPTSEAALAAALAGIAEAAAGLAAAITANADALAAAAAHLEPAKPKPRRRVQRRPTPPAEAATPPPVDPGAAGKTLAGRRLLSEVRRTVVRVKRNQPETAAAFYGAVRAANAAGLPRPIVAAAAGRTTERISQIVNGVDTTAENGAPAEASA